MWELYVATIMTQLSARRPSTWGDRLKAKIYINYDLSSKLQTQIITIPNYNSTTLLSSSRCRHRINLDLFRFDLLWNAKVFDYFTAIKGSHAIPSYPYSRCIGCRIYCPADVLPSCPRANNVNRHRASCC